MFKGFKTIRILLILATTLSFALTGFTLFNFDNKEVAVATTSDAMTPKLPTEILAGEIIFNRNCKSCHRLDTRLIGPGIKNVYSRVDSVWLRSWIMNSSKLIASGDPYAVALFEEYNHTQMPGFDSLPKEDIDALMGYLKYMDTH